MKNSEMKSNLFQH